MPHAHQMSLPRGARKGPSDGRRGPEPPFASGYPRGSTIMRLRSFGCSEAMRITGQNGHESPCQESSHDQFKSRALSRNIAINRTKGKKPDMSVLTTSGLVDLGQQSRLTNTPSRARSPPRQSRPWSARSSLATSRQATCQDRTWADRFDAPSLHSPPHIKIAPYCQSTIRGYRWGWVTRCRRPLRQPRQTPRQSAAPMRPADGTPCAGPAQPGYRPSTSPT
jgi:hypothetical protein